MEKYCLECTKKIEAKRNFNRTKFCSRSCAGKYNGKKRMQDANILAKFVNSGKTSKKIIPSGANSPHWKGGLIKKVCENCKKHFEVSKYKDKKGYGKYCSRECYNSIHVKKRIKANCLQCNKEVEMREKRLKLFKFCSGKCRGIYNRSHGNKRINLIESKMEIILKELNVFYQFEKDVENIAVVDFLLKDKICIFCDGIFWHSQEKDKKRDDFVNSYLRKLGHIIIRFTDEEINNNPEKIKVKLKEVINI